MGLLVAAALSLRSERKSELCVRSPALYWAPMRVAVIGAGGIGGLYGGLLARAGHDVSFLARGEHLRAIQANGLEVRSAEFGTFRAQGVASDNPADLGQADLVLFAVKTYDLEQAAHAAERVLAPQGSLLTFQNGLDAPDEVAAVVGAEHVLIGTTALETTILEPGVIGHLSKFHFVTVSAFNGPPTQMVEHVAATLRSAGATVNVTPDGRQTLWEKAWALIPMATITTVCRASIGEIRAVPASRALIETLLDEVSAVALACGYDLPEARARAHAMLMEIAPPTMKASMARDFERGGRTELEALTGALVRLADAQGVNVPATRTAYAILKLRQQVEAGAENRVGIAAGGR
jgi:2-dehydropantoate 2-reductase